jgi:hypothetical protein
MIAGQAEAPALRRLDHPAAEGMRDRLVPEADADQPCRATRGAQETGKRFEPAMAVIHACRRSGDDIGVARVRRDGQFATANVVACVAVGRPQQRGHHHGVSAMLFSKIARRCAGFEDADMHDRRSRNRAHRSLGKGRAGESPDTPVGLDPPHPDHTGAGFTGRLRSVYLIDGAVEAQHPYAGSRPKKRPVRDRPESF